MRRLLAAAGILALGGLVPLHASGAAEPATRTAKTIVTFDDEGDVAGVPEGITTDGAGGLYVSLFALDQVWHVDPATGAKEKVADVPGGGLTGDLVGLERDPTDGTILAAFKKTEGVDLFDPTHPDCNDASDTVTGIYRLDPQTSEVTPFATRGTGAAVCFADDIAVDAEGNVYASDLALGVIWKFDPSGQGAVWSDSALLGWTDQSDTWNSKYGTPTGGIGVNAIALSPDGKTLFAGTDGGPGSFTGGGLLVRIPINDDGSAGIADLFASGLGINDGLEVGPDGTIYFADTSNSDVWAFSADGSKRLLVASRDQFGDPLDNATSLVLLNGCLYNTQLGFFKAQLGQTDQLRNVVEICGFGDPATDGDYTPPPVLAVKPGTTPTPTPTTAPGATTTTAPSGGTTTTTAPSGGTTTTTSAADSGGGGTDG